MHSGGWWSFIRGDEEAQPAISRQLLRRVAGYARPYIRSIVLMLLAIVVMTLFELIQPLIFKAIIDQAIPRRDVGLLALLALALVGLPLLSNLVGVGQRYLSARVGEGIIYDLRVALYRHMQRMSLRFFTNTRSGELLSRLNSDVVGAQRAVTGTLISIITNAVTVIITLAIMISLQWQLTLLALVLVPLFILPARRVGRILRRLVRQQMERNAEMNAQMGETLNVSGALLVKLFGRADDEVSRFSKRAASVRDIGIQQALVGRWLFMTTALIGALGAALIYGAGGYLAITGTFTVGTIVAFAAYLSQLYAPLSALTNARIDLATSLVSFERVFEVLDLPIEIVDRPGARRLEQVQGHIIFDRVFFSYLGQDGAVAPQLTPRKQDEPGPILQILSRRWALEDVSFSIEPGQLAALVGPSGAGKTTITYLLPRLYDPSRGSITIDGVDLRDIQLDSLSQHIGMVTQETFLIHDTIRANLLYARPDATQEELESACRAANIHDVICSLPQGYDTVVGERGYRLSGGEKQRIAIARVILKNPAILVLDEATSNLDSQSEALIQQALKPLMQGRTSLVIAHRLSTILAADVILVMNEGRLVEQGTHAELLARGGLYASLYRTQFRDQLASADGSKERRLDVLRQD